jgi:hypothetical protein
MNRFAVSVLSGCLLAAATHTSVHAQQQGMSSGDVSDWSSFATRAPEPERLAERNDLTFKAIAHEGPFSPVREAAQRACWSKSSNWR